MLIHLSQHWTKVQASTTVPFSSPQQATGFPNGGLHELPTWMKQAQRGVDWGAILVLGFCLIVAWPFLATESLPSFNDSEHYVYRTADYAEALKEGHLYPRWSPHVLGGYGAEIPNYYPPGAVYTAAVIEVLFTNDSIAAVRLTFVISIVLAGSMVYAFVKQRTNALSGVFASLVYISSPFVALTAPHMLGDLELVLGIALLPMFLWAINRSLMRNHTLDYVLIAFICAAIIITKPVILTQAFLLSIALFAVHFHKQIQWRKLGTILSAVTVGIGLSAFYWMPALIERSFVKWSNALIDAPDRQLSLQGLIARTQLFDANILVREAQFNIGWLLVGFTMLTLIALIYWRINLRFPLVFLTVGLVLIILGVTFFSNNTELLVGIVLCLAITSSYPISILPKNPSRIALSALALVFVFIGTLPIWFMVDPQLVIESDTMISQQEYENKAWGIALLAPGQAIPSFVSPTNQNLPTIAEDTATQGRILNNGSFQTTLLEEGAFGGSYRIINQEATRIDSILYLRAYSIGWQAYLNDQALDISPDNDGLIEVTFPDGLLLSAGDNLVLSFVYGSTPVRIVSWIITTLSGIVIVIIGWQRWQTIEISFDTSDLLTRWQIALVAILLILGGLLRYSPSYDFISSYITYPITNITEDTTSVQNKIDEIELWRFSFDNHPYQAGEVLDLRLFWKLYNPIKNQHQIRLRMINRENQTTIVIHPFHYPGQFPTNRWLSNLSLVVSYKIPLPDDLDSGSYTIMVDVARCPDTCLQGSRILPQTITTIQLPLNLIVK